MPDKAPIGPEKIIFGTMRLLEAGRTVDETADYFAALHDLGIRTIHSSHEYDSFPLVADALRVMARQEPRRLFRHIVKLAEPSFDDGDRFSAGRLSQRIDHYRRALRVEIIDDVQWMWRRKLDRDRARIADFMGGADTIREAVEKEKARGSTGRLFCFPYTPDFAWFALAQDWVDGLAVYRNSKEREYDVALGQAAAAAKTVIVIRPFFGGKLAARDDAANLLRHALNGPAIEAAVLSTNSIAHMRALLS